MDQNLNEYNNENLGSSISIPIESIQNFIETGKWTKLLSILGFVGIGFMVIAAFFIGTFMSYFDTGQSQIPYQGVLIGMIYLVMAGLYFFPILYLYKFSTNIKNALKTKDSDMFNIAISNLKSHYKFIGVLAIVIMAIYLLVFIGLVVMAMVM